LTPRHADRLDARAQRALDVLLARADLRHAVLSNCGESRFVQLGAMLPGIPIVKGYRGEDGEIFRVRMGDEDRWTRPARGLLRSIRKPDPCLVGFPLEYLGVPASAAAVVGDQHLTDVAAANLAGVRSVKVPTLGAEALPPVARLLQTVDAWSYQVSRWLPPRPAPAGPISGPPSSRSRPQNRHDT
jgi:hypothetical protein